MAQPAPAVCPLCQEPILAHHDVAKDAERMVHLQCWLRRVRPPDEAGPVPPPEPERGNG